MKKVLNASIANEVQRAAEPFKRKISSRNPALSFAVLSGYNFIFFS